MEHPPENATQYYPLAFTSASDFVQVFDSALRTGKKKLHSWQKEMLDYLSDKDSLVLGKRPRYTIAEKLKLIMCAANGSGKDAYVIAGFVAFVLCCWIRYKIIVTSSSGLQLDTQTRTYIKNLCTEVNTYLKYNGVMDEDAIDIKTDQFTCNVFEKEDGSKFSLTGSQVITFVTDEGGRAEGHHPWPDALDGEGVIIIVNEGKSVPDEIYEHLGKCTYNIWLEVSSAGEASQHFYKTFSTAHPFVNGWVPNEFVARTITSYDCPHKPLSAIEADKKEHGENSEFFRTTHLSQFVSTSSSVVITQTTLDKCLANAKNKIDIGLSRRAGLDLGGGGDPSALYVFDNNVCVGKEMWRSKDTEATVDLLCGTPTESGLFSKYGLLPANIFGDDNGLGQPILDGCARREIKKGETATWDVVRIRNQGSAFDKSKYLNCGIEMWVRFARLIEECMIVFLEDDLQLFKELVNRHYDTSSGAVSKRKLLSKPEEKALGHPSPNSADAVVLAFTGLTVVDFYTGKVTPITNRGFPTMEALVQAMPKSDSQGVKPGPSYDHIINQMRPQYDGNEKLKTSGVKFANPVSVLQSIYDA